MLPQCQIKPCACCSPPQVTLGGRKALSPPLPKREGSLVKHLLLDRKSSKNQRVRTVSLCMAAAKGAGTADKKCSVLFVCLGNICRSPSAEAVFRHHVELKGLSDSFVIDSCGTGGGSPDWYKKGGWSYHTGDKADRRMTQYAAKRDIKLTSLSRPLKPQDLQTFDYIVCMDYENVQAVRRAAAHWKQTGLLPKDFEAETVLMCDYLRDPKFVGTKEVPDPYYDERFDVVLDLLEDACEGMLHKILA